MASNPVDLVYVDGASVSKSTVRSYEKLRVRKDMADANEVRNTSLSGQYAGIYVRSLQSDFDLDTADTTTADDGSNCIIDDDGNRFKRVEVSVAEADVTITATGDVTIADDDTRTIFGISNTSGAPISVYLPDAATWDGPIQVVDKGGNAGAYPITVRSKLSTLQTVMGVSSYLLDGNHMGIRLIPWSDATGWH